MLKWHVFDHLSHSPDYKRVRYPVFFFFLSCPFVYKKNSQVVNKNKINIAYSYYRRSYTGQK